MGLREDIRAIYQENQNISSKEIIARLGITPTKAFWRILNEEQVNLRGVYPGKRRNSHAHNRVQPKGTVYFIPPSKEGSK